MKIKSSPQISYMSLFCPAQQIKLKKQNNSLYHELELGNPNQQYSTWNSTTIISIETLCVRSREKCGKGLLLLWKRLLYLTPTFLTDYKLIFLQIPPLMTVSESCYKLLPVRLRGRMSISGNISML